MAVTREQRKAMLRIRKLSNGAGDGQASLDQIIAEAVAAGGQVPKAPKKKAARLGRHGLDRMYRGGIDRAEGEERMAVTREQRKAMLRIRKLSNGAGDGQASLDQIIAEAVAAGGQVQKAPKKRPATESGGE